MTTRRPRTLCVNCHDDDRLCDCAYDHYQNRARPLYPASVCGDCYDSMREGEGSAWFGVTLYGIVDCADTELDPDMGCVRTEFSKQPCDACRSVLAGTRWLASTRH